MATRDCDFALAIVKGLVEHNDGAAYFGSTMGYRAHEARGIAKGWLVRGMKELSSHDVVETTLLTDAGRKAYEEYKLSTLPNKYGSRAYFWQWADIPHEPLTYYCDELRHLVCVPYSIPNLHRMARELNIKRCWFHRGGEGEYTHYDIPKRRIAEIQAKCNVVTGRDILAIIKGQVPWA